MVSDEVRYGVRCEVNERMATDAAITEHERCDPRNLAASLDVLETLARVRSLTDLTTSAMTESMGTSADVGFLVDRGLLASSPDHPTTYRLTPAAHQLVERWRAAAGAALAEDWAALERERSTVERWRTDLLSTVSHELRTPLTLIRTSIGLLLDSQPDEAMRLRLLRNIKQSTDRMNALVTDLLDLVRLRHERAELQTRRIDVHDLVSGVTTLIRPLLEERRQQLVVEMPRPAPRILGDYRRLERLLLNLVANANKFAPPETVIHVSVSATVEWVTITVADQGPGIPAEVMPHLFEQFYTARTSSSSHNIGVGLGLPIARSIAEAHGGEIIVESQVGHGSAFVVRLPRETPRGKVVE